MTPSSGSTPGTGTGVHVHVGEPAHVFGSWGQCEPPNTPGQEPVCVGPRRRSVARLFKRTRPGGRSLHRPLGPHSHQPERAGGVPPAGLEPPTPDGWLQQGVVSTNGAGPVVRGRGHGRVTHSGRDPGGTQGCPRASAGPVGGPSSPEAAACPGGGGADGLISQWKHGVHQGNVANDLTANEAQRRRRTPSWWK